MIASSSRMPHPVQGPPVALSWVLPLYRTAQQLEELLARIDAVSDRLCVDIEVILVDDACPEGCGSLAESAAMRDPRVRVLRLPRNQGQDAALRAGLGLSRGAWVAILDADLQDPPEALEQLWPMRHQSDVVFARRTGLYSSRGRRLTSRLYRALFSTIGGLPPGACLYALLDRATVERINACQDERRSLLVLVASAATTSGCVTVQRSRRHRGNSSYTSLGRSIKAARSLWQIVAFRASRFLFGYPGRT